MEHADCHDGLSQFRLPSFSLDREEVDVWINDDGSVSIEYAFTFTCDPGAHPIDAVDVGLPTGDYSLSGMSATVDGQSVQRIDTDYQGSGDYGVAVVVDACWVCVWWRRRCRSRRSRQSRNRLLR